MPNVIKPTIALGGNKESDICNDSFKAASSSSSMQVSTTNKKMGGVIGALVMVYSSVEKAGINSAGWFCSEMAAYLKEIDF